MDQRRGILVRASRTIWSYGLGALVGAMLTAASSAAGAESPGASADPLPQIRRFADNLIEHARDRYGPKHTPLFVCQLDVDAKTLPPADTRLYASSNRGGAGPHMNNLQFDSGRLRLLYALTEVTGEKRYAEAADEYLRYYLAHLPDEETGFFPWGDHRGYDVVRDETIRAVHEFKCTYPPWDEMYRVDPDAVTRQIESLRLHVIDPARSYGFNRHCPPDEFIEWGSPPGGAYVAAWAFLYKQTGDRKHLEWAHRMADYLWGLRNPETDLLAAHPFDPAYPDAAKSDRAMARASRTEYMGQITWFAANLLRTAELLGPDEGATFRQQALAYYRAFTRRMDVRPDGSFFATFDLAKGEPRFERIGEGWQIIPQVGSPIGWSNGVVGVRAPFSLAFGHKMTGEADLRETFDRLVPLVRLERFRKLDRAPEPVAAGLLAQVIVGFLNMHQASGEPAYLDEAEMLCRYATTHFYRDGWFVCGVPTVPRYRDPNVDGWRTYSNRGGSDDLALAVLRVWLVGAGRDDVVADDVGCYF